MRLHISRKFPGLFLCSVVAILCAGLNVNGQVALQPVSAANVVVSSSQVEVEVASPGPEGAAAANPEEAGQGGEPKEPEKSFDERRIEALMKANIDRSLPTMLKAWSTVEKPEEEKEGKAKQKDKSPTAKVANIYEDFVILEFEKKATFKKDESIEVHLDDRLVGTVKLLSVEENKASGKFQVAENAAAEEAAKEDPAPEKPTDGAAVKKVAPEAAVEEAGDTGATDGDSVAEESGAADSDATVTSDSDDDADSEKPDVEQAAKPEPNSQEVESSEEATKKEDDAEESKPTVAKTWETLKVGTSVTIKKPNDESAKKAKEETQIKEEVAQWTKMVTLGKWVEVKAYLATLKEDDADQIYGHLLSKLSSAPGANEEAGGGGGNDREKPPSNFLSPEDILQVTDAAPGPWKVSVTGNKKFKGMGTQVAGKWSGKITIDDPSIPDGVVMPEIKVTLDIQLDGNAVSGAMVISNMGQTQSMTLDGGQYDSESGALTFSATQEGSTMNADLTVEDGTMTGLFSVAAGGPSMRFEGELVEPADQPVEEEDDEEEVADAETTGNELPEGMELPPGVTIDQIPPEQLEEMKKAFAEKNGGDKKKSKGGKSHIPGLARLVKKSKKEGFDFSSYIETIKKGASGIGGEDKDQKLIAADLFLKAGMIDEVEQFLPSLAESIKEEKVVPVKMWSQLALKKYRSKQVAKWLNCAWEANSALSVMEKSGDKEKEAAMANLIELSSKIDKEIGEKWLDESFTESPERGMKILSNLGSKSSTMARQAASISEDERLKLLRLQNGAVEKLLKISPELADQWSDALTLLADNWLKEADIAVQYGSSNSGGGYWDYDQYGNSYWAGDDQYSRRYGRNDEPQPIRIGDVLEIAPGEEWRKRVRPTLKTQMQGLFAKMHLHVNEEDKAFPWIEKVAGQNPKVAKSLVEEFLKIWTKNHNPNDDKQRRNPYIYFYGFDQKADAIPLTRSKQQRNLEELQGWVDRIRAMKLEELDEKLLADAFTTCHSSAEVYDLDRVKSVFGELGSLKPKTIAAICEKMRANLGSNWREQRCD